MGVRCNKRHIFGFWLHGVDTRGVKIIYSTLQVSKYFVIIAFAAAR